MFSVPENAAEALICTVVDVPLLDEDMLLENAPVFSMLKDPIE
ncbi:hypothetical protein [Fluviibacterium sp. S390]